MFPLQIQLGVHSFIIFTLHGEKNQLPHNFECYYYIPVTTFLQLKIIRNLAHTIM